MRGTSLVETMIVLVILGILAGMSVPRAAGLRDRLLVQQHTQGIVVAYQRARLAAVLSGGSVLLRIAPDRFSVWRLEGGDSSLIWQRQGPIMDGVTLTGPTRLIFAPGGITLGVANGRFVLSRGAISRTLVASRLGRLRAVTPRRVRRRRRSAP